MRISPLAKISFVALIVIFGLPATSRAQEFDIEREALKFDDKIVIALDQISSESTTEFSGVSQKQATTEGNRIEAVGSLVVGPVAFTVGGESGEFEVETSNYSQRNLAEESGVAIALAFGPIRLIESASRRLLEVEVKDAATGADVVDRVEWLTNSQTGVFLSIFFFRFGLSVADSELNWRHKESGVVLVDERYEFINIAQGYAIIVNDGEGLLFTAELKQAAAPKVAGNVIDLERSSETYRGVTLGWMFSDGSGISISFTEFESELGFVDTYRQEVTVESVGFGFEFNNGLLFNISQSTQRTQETLYFGGSPFDTVTVRDTTRARLGLRF